MINFPSDSIPKLITFIGLAIAALAFFALNDNIERFGNTVVAVKMARAEATEINDQMLASLQESIKIIGEANDAYSKANELLKSGDKVGVNTQIQIANALYADAQITRARSAAAREKAALKYVEVARLMAASDYSSERVGIKHWGLNGAFIFGFIVFMLGLSEWKKDVVKSRDRKPRRLSRKRSDG